ncbi:MAG: InlB B-repeat-containing protein [Dokdonella sp.]|uniref:InlB B-repeat-containing protein n=1 Tax=Dokdonella sp. TaxID=2291710 RepID=UPI003F7DA0FC
MSALFLGCSTLAAAPAQRTRVDQHGDFALIGNTLGQDCAIGVPPPLVGTVAACGTNTSDSAPDIFWRSDSPAVGQAMADTTITPATARSSAVLALPEGAQVTQAFLYWAAMATTPTATANLSRPGDFATPVTSLQTIVGANSAYLDVADVTALVQANGNGVYRFGGASMDNWVNLSNSNVFAGWWMVVLYRLDTEPLRSVTVFDGLDAVSNATPLSLSAGGFIALPSAGLPKLGIVALEGDAVTASDDLSVNGVPVSDAQNPTNNVFNGSHSALGSPVSTTGDLPQTSGLPGSLSGVDLDVFDLSLQVGAGATQAAIAASTAADIYHVASLITSIPTVRPLFDTSTLSVIDLNGGAAMPGDVLQYTATATNTGTEAGTSTVFTLNLPAGTTYVPGSLEVIAGANAGAKTDAADGDQAEYDAANSRIVMRVGTGANGANGGTLGTGESTTVRFSLAVAPFCSGTVSIPASGAIASTGATTLAAVADVTDADPGTPGAQPATTTVDVRCLTLATIGVGGGTITPAPSGMSCSSGIGCLQPMPANALIALSATADANSTFAGWFGDASGSANPVAVTMDVDRNVTAHFLGNQAITNFIALPATPAYAPGGSFVVSANGGPSSQPVVFAGLTPGTCSVVGTTVSILAAGTCSITANQAGDANYAPAPEAQLDVTIAPGAQAITDFVATPAAPVFTPGGTFTVSANGGASGQPVVFGDITPATCTVAGSTVTMLASGPCTISADQAGDANYAPAPQATLTVMLGIDDRIFASGFDSPPP